MTLWGRASTAVKRENRDEKIKSQLTDENAVRNQLRMVACISSRNLKDMYIDDRHLPRNSESRAPTKKSIKNGYAKTW